MNNEKMTGKDGRGSRVLLYLALHAGFFLSSFSGLCAKMAASQTQIWKLFAWYAADLMIMGIYAVLWQQILKRLPLTVAYANKPVGLIWAMIWGSLIFHERITLKMLAGAAVIFAGIYLVVTDHE